ncbi:MAG: hypothetical protein QXS93_02025 [Candidatus Micrarchaeia archaeon]
MAGSPFDMKIELSPLRLKKGDERPVQMKVWLKNKEPEDVLASLVVDIPTAVGFDKTGIVFKKEIRIGKMLPNEEKVFFVDLFSHPKTTPGSYTVKVSANKHYRGFSHIIGSTLKEITLRVV